MVLAASIAVLRINRTVVFRMPGIFSVAIQALPVLPASADRVEFAPLGVSLARIAVFCGSWANYRSHSLPADRRSSHMFQNNLAILFEDETSGYSISSSL